MVTDLQATINRSNVFEYIFTKKDEDLLKTFKTLLAKDQKTEFSSDDFRKYGLDRFIKDTQHGIGTFFAKLVHNKKAKKIGYTRSEFASNHGRQIRTYCWTGL